MMNPFCDLLTITENHCADVMNQLKTTDLQIVLYGAGLTAHMKAEVLEANGVTNYVYCVDDQYMQNLSNNGEGRVIPSSKIDTVYDRYMLVHAREAGYNGKIPQHFRNATCILNWSIVSFPCEPIDLKFVADNISKFEQTYAWLLDDYSKQSLIAYLKVKLTMNGDYVLPYVNDFNIRDPYFFDDIYHIQAHTAFVDCGAYIGDTVSEFVQHYPQYSRIVAFEPNDRSFDELQANASTLRNVTLVKKGCADAPGVVRFDENDSNLSSSTVSDNGSLSIEIDKVDSYTSGLRVGLLKMDIEGSELIALHGAAETIVRDKPVLLICAYHKAADLITLPQYIKSLVPEYKLFFRNAASVATNQNESVLIAVTDKDRR